MKVLTPYRRRKKLSRRRESGSLGWKIPPKRSGLCSLTCKSHYSRILIFTIFYTPWTLAFEDGETPFVVLESLLDLVFILDLIMNFRFAFINANLELIDEPKVISFYLRKSQEPILGHGSWLIFWLFFLSTMYWPYMELNTGSWQRSLSWQECYDCSRLFEKEKRYLTSWDQWYLLVTHQSFFCSSS